MKLLGLLTFEECECHPLPSFGPLKQYKLDYLREIYMPVAGAIMISLARPYKGTKTFGLFIKAFGSLWICNVAWTKT